MINKGVFVFGSSVNAIFDITNLIDCLDWLNAYTVFRRLFCVSLNGVVHWLMVEGWVW